MIQCVRSDHPLRQSTDRCQWHLLVDSPYSGYGKNVRCQWCVMIFIGTFLDSWNSFFNNSVLVMNRDVGLDVQQHDCT